MAYLYNGKVAFVVSVFKKSIRYIIPQKIYHRCRNVGVFSHNVDRAAFLLVDVACWKIAYPNGAGIVLACTGFL